MRFLTTTLLASLFAAACVAQQPPTLSTEHAVLQKDVGTWTGTMTLYPDNAAEPMVLPVRETNTLFAGGLWVLSDFDAGPFKGRGQFGYDLKKKKYVGTWIDNMNPFMSVMEGDYDEEKKQMVMEFTGIDPVSREPERMKSVMTTPGCGMSSIPSIPHHRRWRI